MSPRVGIAVALDHIATPSYGTAAAVVATAANFVRTSPVLCQQTADINLNDEIYQEAVNELRSVKVPRHLESWEPKLKSVGSVFYPRNICFTALRSLAFGLLPVWSDYFQEVERREEDAFRQGLDYPEEWPPLPIDRLHEACWSSVWTTLRDLATWTVRRLFEARVDQKASRDTRYRLLTDFRTICLDYGRLRKERGLYIALLCAPSCMETLVHANLLGAAADCTVSSIYNIYRVIVQPLMTTRQQLPAPYILKRSAKIFAANALRCTISLSCASLGATVGALLFSMARSPYVGAIVVGSALDLFVTFYIVTPLLNDWALGKLSPSDPGPSSSGANNDELPGDDFELHLD